MLVRLEALHDAGYRREELAGSDTGVFCGVHRTELNGTADSAYSHLGNLSCVVAGRVSHCFALNGPCMVLNTACSSGLVALDSAVQHITAGRCTVAVVASANFCLDPPQSAQDGDV